MEVRIAENVFPPAPITGSGMKIPHKNSVMKEHSIDGHGVYKISSMSFEKYVSAK